MNKKKIIALVVCLLILYVLTPYILAFSGFYEYRLDQLRGEINDVVGARATDVSQCKTVGFGHVPCGGFDSFLIYSVESTDENKLITLVNKFNNVDEKNNEAKMISSGCSIVMEPSLVLDNEKCLEESF